MPRDRWVRRFYSLGWWLVLPVAFGYLLWRSRLQPAYRLHWPERLGLGPRPSADGVGRVWIHAVSVGETRASAPLIAELLQRRPGCRVLLTHATPTGRETGAEFASRWPGRIEQCYLPYDLPFAQRAFLRRWRPACGLLVETEVWPNLAFEAQRAGVPLALVNGRLSARSLARGLRQRALIAPALQRLSRIGVQTADDAQRLSRLGRQADAVCGNLKYDLEPAPELVARGRRWRELAGRRPVIVAASTRDGEEALLLTAWHEARAEASDPVGGIGQPSPGPLLVIVPRHPQRFPAVGRAIAETAEGRWASRADLDRPDATEILGRADILMGDSMGEMAAWYGMADVAIIGGSLLPFGAQNLIEANAVGCPVVLGPSTFNFAQAAAASLAAGAAVGVADADEAIRVAREIAGNASRHQRMAAAAIAFTQEHRGATRRTLALIESLLPAPAAPGTPPVRG